ERRVRTCRAPGSLELDRREGDTRLTQAAAVEEPDDRGARRLVREAQQSVRRAVDDEALRVGEPTADLDRVLFRCVAVECTADEERGHPRLHRRAVGIGQGPDAEGAADSLVA